jgi:hypothetical protein
VSPFQRNVLNNIFPFFTWNTKNMPLQIRTIFKGHPMLGLVLKVKRYFEDINPIYEYDEKSPAWLRQQFGIPIATINGKPYIWSTNLPIADLLKMPKDYISSMSPLLKMGIELSTLPQGFGVDIWTGRPLFESGKSTYTEAPGWIDQVLGRLPKNVMEAIGLQKAKEPFTGAETTYYPKIIDYFVKQLPFLTAAEKVIPSRGEISRGEYASDLGQVVGGLTLYPYDVDKVNYWYYQDQLNKAETAFKKISDNADFNETADNFLSQKMKYENDASSPLVTYKLSLLNNFLDQYVYSEVELTEKDYDLYSKLRDNIIDSHYRKNSKSGVYEFRRIDEAEEYLQELVNANYGDMEYLKGLVSFDEMTAVKKFNDEQLKEQVRKFLKEGLKK